MTYADLNKTFISIFKQPAQVIVRSPGRVNIIGEHTDYNEGFVLPAAIDKAIFVALSKRDDQQICLYSVAFDERMDMMLEDVKPVDGWANYVLGVVDQLIKRGYEFTGFNLTLDGDVPIGAGLSSSAAVECATGFALNELFGLGLQKLAMVQIAQKAEHTFAGVNVGIMDMFASMFGKKDCVIKLDCRSLEYEYKPFELGDYRIVLFNTNVEHSLASTEYNKRRQECEQGVAWVREHYPEIKSLRDVNMQMLTEHVLPKDDLIFKRCKYVVEEIERLIAACIDLEKGDIVALGQKMYRTHEGLSKEYEVSCKELDFLVDSVRNNPAVIGARMMGGGFGGCTINLVKQSSIEEISKTLAASYKQHMGLELTTYVAQIEDGTGLMQE